MDLGFSSVVLEHLAPVYWETRCRDETVDAIIPDTSPDVERIIMVSALPVMRSKECRSGSVSITGGIRFSVLYAAEQEQKPRCLEVYLPFSVRADSPELSEDARVVFRPWMRGADARPVHSRKLTVRGELCWYLCAYEPQSDTLPVPREVPEEVQLLRGEYPLLLPSETAERSFRITEELQLPQARPLAGQVVYYEPRLELSEKRLAGNKAVFKGLVHVSVLYESAEQRLCTMETELPFSQFCELEKLYDDGEPEVHLTLTGCELERTTRQEGDGLLLTVHILAQAVVSDRQPVTVCSDAYSLGGTLQTEWKPLEMITCLDRHCFTRTVRESWQGSVGEIVALWPCLDEPFVQQGELGTELVVNGGVRVLYSDAAGILQETCIRFSLREQLPSAPEVRFCLTAEVVGEPAVLPAAGGMELRCTVHCCALGMADFSARTLSSGEFIPKEASRERSAVIVRRTGNGERLWDIAKANGTTVERIRRANQLESDETGCGILLIPT